VIVSKQRANLGFADPLDDFNPVEWKSTQTRPYTVRPKPEEAAKAAKAAGFVSREHKVTPEVNDKPQDHAIKSPQRRRRTGRNAQFNLKARPETIEAYCALADTQGWGLGETLEKAVELLQREFGNG
jgi:hypothetical protein